jgi:acetylornithine deacetylase/succinyl-diaminopimelate desuccinylase-like protein
MDQNFLLQRLEILGKIGWDDDKGVVATECSEANGQARRQIIEWMQADGLEVTLDRIGNIIGILKPGTGNTNAAPVIIGSHIDTVPTGGLYDGRYGVLAGMETARRLKQMEAEGKITVTRPVIVGAWTGEEGSYFQPSMPGSRATVNPANTDKCLDECKSIQAEREGTALRQALMEINAAGTAEPGFFLADVNLSEATYIEFHIEQGKVLDNAHESLGVVTGIYGVSQSQITVTANDQSSDVVLAVAALTCAINDRIKEDTIERGTVGSIETKTQYVPQKPALKITFSGEGDHAGGRPMPGRRDAAYAAATLLKRMVDDVIAENMMVINGAANIIPARAIATISAPEGADVNQWKARLQNHLRDIYTERLVSSEIEEILISQHAIESKLTTDKRHIEASCIEESERALERAMQAVAEKYSVTITQKQGTREMPVHFDKTLIELMKNCADANPYVAKPNGKVRTMLSGAFHDAMNFGRVMPSVMGFVPSVNGISHNKAEYTHEKDLNAGVDVLTSMVVAELNKS